MRIFIVANEMLYQGLHGIFDQAVVEVETVEQGYDIGQEMSADLITVYGLESDYEDNEIDLEEDIEYYVYLWEIKNDVKCTIEELNNIAFELGYELFVEKYCDKELG